MFLVDIEVGEGERGGKRRKGNGRREVGSKAKERESEGGRDKVRAAERERYVGSKRGGERDKTEIRRKKEEIASEAEGSLWTCGSLWQWTVSPSHQMWSGPAHHRWSVAG